MENNKFNIRPISCLGRPLRKMLFILGPLRGVPTSIRLFFEQLMRSMEFGFAANYAMDLFIKGIINRDEMLARINELERKFNKS